MLIVISSRAYTENRKRLLCKQPLYEHCFTIPLSCRSDKIFYAWREKGLVSRLPEAKIWFSPIIPQSAYLELYALKNL